jgi:hypothetical protein
MLVHRRLRLLAFLSRTGAAKGCPVGHEISQSLPRRRPGFRRVPFVRDGVSDLGGAPAPRMTAPDILPSTLRTVSASAASPFRGSFTHPTQSLCTLRHGRHLPRRNTRYQAGATPYLGRTCTGWNAPASPGAHVMDCNGGPLLPALRPLAACRGDVAVLRSWWLGRDGAAAPAGRRAGAAGSWSPRSARRRRGAAISRAVPWPRQDCRTPRPIRQSRSSR